LQHARSRPPSRRHELCSYPRRIWRIEFEALRGIFLRVVQYHAGAGTAHGLVDAFMSANASKAFLAAGDRYHPKGTKVASLV